MANQYFYFVSSLPHFVFDGEYDITVSQFLEDCGRLLDTQDAALVRAALGARPPTVTVADPVVHQLVYFNVNVKNALSWFRAERKGTDPNAAIRGDRFVDVYLSEVLNQISKEANLLTAETVLDQAKWRMIDDLTLGRFYDEAVVIASGLKLQILDRHKMIRSAEGMNKFEAFQKSAEQYQHMNKPAQEAAV